MIIFYFDDLERSISRSHRFRSLIPHKRAELGHVTIKHYRNSYF